MTFRISDWFQLGLSFSLGAVGACSSSPAPTGQANTDSPSTSTTAGVTESTGTASSSVSGSTVGPTTGAGPGSTTSVSNSSTSTTSTTTGGTAIGASGSAGGAGGKTGTGTGTSVSTADTTGTSMSAGGASSVDTTGNGGASTTGAGPLTPTTVWIAGDSTVANGNTPCPAGWGKHFAPYFDSLVTITNSAVGGRSVRTWLYNVTTNMDASGECILQTDSGGQPTLQARWQAMLDGMSEGDTLLIQFGINDGSATCDRHVGLEAFKDSYGMMAEAAKARGAQPIFITPVSAIACNGTEARGTRGGYVDATFEAGVEYDVPVIDLHQLSVDLYDSLGFCPVPGGDVSADTTGPVGDFFCDDHTHFSDSGAVEIAGLVARALRDQDLDLARYLTE